MSSSAEAQIMLSVITTFCFTNWARWHLPNYLEPICIQLFACDILKKKRRLPGNLILLPAPSNRNLWTRVRWSLGTTSLWKTHHRLSLTPPCPLIFHDLSALCLSNSALSSSFTSPFLLSFHPSLAFFTSSLALFSRELRHHYSVRWLTFHPLSY